MKNELNIERAEETIALLLSKLLSEDIITQKDIDKVIDYIYEEKTTS